MRIVIEPLSQHATLTRAPVVALLLVTKSFLHHQVGHRPDHGGDRLAAAHRLRGFFAGLKKRQGITVTVLERIRQVGPGVQGSRGSHSIFAVVA